jgi:hypothetical protein
MKVKPDGTTEAKLEVESKHRDIHLQSVFRFPRRRVYLSTPAAVASATGTRSWNTNAVGVQ